MEQSKKWYESRTILSALVGIIALGLQVMNVDIVEQSEVEKIVYMLAEGVAFICAILGRIEAEKKITL